MSVRRIILCRHFPRKRESRDNKRWSAQPTAPPVAAKQASLSISSWSAKADHPRVCRPRTGCFRAGRDSRTGRPWACPKRPRLCDGPNLANAGQEGRKVRKLGASKLVDGRAFADHDAREGEARKHQPRPCGAATTVARAGTGVGVLPMASYHRPREPGRRAGGAARGGDHGDRRGEPIIFRRGSSGRPMRICSISPPYQRCAGSTITPQPFPHRRPVSPGPTSSRADLPPCFDGLKLAAREIGGVQIQNTGTLAGNVCNASPAADSMPNLLALDTEVEPGLDPGSAPPEAGRVRHPAIARRCAAPTSW